MTRHLKTCGLPAAYAPAESATKLPPAFHLFVDARYNKTYWMHLAVPVEAPLSGVDTFLRRIWLECCGHLSGFTVAGQQFVSQGARELGEAGMGVRLSRILQPGMVFRYEYDYGSTTELNIKVLSLRDAGTARGAVELLARNDDPSFACELCGAQPATQICTQCAWKDKGWMCDRCAAGHDCGEEMMLPVVNSPRAGVCGYTG
jgi:hypothetical protein